MTSLLVGGCEDREGITMSTDCKSSGMTSSKSGGTTGGSGGGVAWAGTTDTPNTVALVMFAVSPVRI